MSTFRGSFELRPVPSSVPTARHVVVEVLRAWEVPHDVDDAALLTTELVANVLAHVGGEATLTVEVDSSDEWLRIGPAKVFQDGSGGGRTAAMTVDYRNDPGNRGITIYDQAGLDERFIRANAAGDCGCSSSSRAGGAARRPATASGSGSSSPQPCDRPPGLAARTSGDGLRNSRPHERTRR